MDTEESDSLPSTKKTAEMTEEGGITPSSTSDIDVSVMSKSADPQIVCASRPCRCSQSGQGLRIILVRDWTCSLEIL